MPEEDFIHRQIVRPQGGGRVLLIFLPILVFVVFVTFALISLNSGSDLASTTQATSVLGTESENLIDKESP